MSVRTLRLEFLDTWHVGCGRGDGSNLDAVVARDADALPYVPGRMLRGVLRDAAEALAAWGHADPAAVLQLFGGLAERSDAPGRSLSQAGCLTVSDARLPAAERAVLAAPAPGEPDPQAALRAALFVPSFQTAIDLDSGTALDGSLRGVELVVPLTLQAEVGITGVDADAPWALLDRALPLVRAIGAMKTRGHGRVALDWEKHA
ncbi:RAMP superfamily CRISPR-associated protein [Rubrivivax benzoatilyticus]|uniref:CRISPR type III-associated protein domain-containing protein n=1 Tax=Rubrivivax benzoatilyticus TaxID=316997 RepID=A0ABX0HWW4_9BURK|nr:RAMP superfamily CRISPR-associated protein [Rubrivivax benzoatilyticus]EGJ09045.1 hypothetical protein RBXJA2T_01890 [Rubrivivax benzoatilyticus JA2 = ATCC BAA-35]NHK99500.1 hypothetical protein [Rubrivivax benzoatilyticus]NHL25374.1 hypothetical protein [Rubrivivax benzoatilyticus]